MKLYSLHPLPNFVKLSVIQFNLSRYLIRGRGCLWVAMLASQYICTTVFAVDAPFETLTRRNLLRARQEILTMCKLVKFRCAIVNHSDFGGATNASHLVVFRGVDSTGFHPPASMPRVLKHLLNSAAPGRAREIDAPAPLQGAVARAPIVVEGLLRREGLWDVHHPAGLVACPSVFASSGLAGSLAD